MTSAPLGQRSLDVASLALLRWAIHARQTVLFGASLVVLALSPSNYRSLAMRHALARHAWLDTAPILAGFTLLSALLTVVLTRIVVVTARSYGLSQYALEMVVRVLVLELIPLTAALFVALRCTIPNGAALAELRRSGRFEELRRQGRDPLVHEVLPRMLAGAFSTVTLAALSCVVATVLAYFAVYGATVAGLPAYTRMFGHVFNPSVALIFTAKTIFFSLAVSIIPVSAGARTTAAPGSREGAALQGLVRMFAVLLLLEAASLMGNYY
ncbi:MULTISPECIES: MlaE family ABC transporter permease [Ramlibacter]|uniref:ABC transporter permease n=1 Tax=Ramlibacter pinisoli TaxID=2682844 RepID=A0A6N8ITV1_9BURK|nr:MULTISPECIES: ABC transporter permease [Ramlibacter]MBA2965294.1 ABC transporter permease [Ramlibacter sp. CGMCC 1.13660]MVQ30258.1 ABC transporter permease [Ramlibacter pinisoli]